MAERTAVVRAEFRDDFTGQAMVAEVQARRTGDAFEDMGDGADSSSKDLKKNRSEMDKSTKSSSKLDNALKKLGTRGVGLKYLWKAAMPVAILAAINAAIPLIGALSAGVIGLVGNLSRAAGLAGTLPGMLVAIGGGAAAVIAGFKGIGEAVKALNEGDPTKINEALKDLSPTARGLAGDLARLDPTLKALRRNASEAVLPGVRDALRSLVRTAPEVNGLLTTMGGVVGSLAREGAAMLSSGPWRRDFATITGDSGYALRQAGVGGLGFMDALRHIAVAAGPVLRQLADLVAKAGAWASRSAEAGRSTGRMAAFFDRALISARQWGRIVGNLTAGIFHLFRGGADLGDHLTTSLENLTRRFRDFGASAAGQRKYVAWFDSMRPALRELGGLVRDLGVVLLRLTGGRHQSALVALIAGLRTMLPVLEELLNNVGPQLGPALADLAVGFIRLLNALPLGAITMFTRALGFLLNTVGRVPVLGTLVHLFLLTGSAIKAVKWLDSATGAKKLWNALFKVNEATGKTSAAMAIAKARTLALAAAQRVAAVASKLWAAAVWLVNAAMNANPAVLITTAVIALGVAIYLAYKKFKPFRDFVDKTWQIVLGGARRLWNWVKGNWPLLLAILTGPFGLAILAIQRNWDSIVAGARSARDWIVGVWNGVYDFFAKLPGRIASVAHGMWDFVWDEFRKVFHRITNFEVLGVSLNDVGGVARGALDALNPMGDTTRPRGHTGSLTRTLGAHAHLERATSGHRRIANVTHGGFRGSDHHHGRALDLVGSGLNGYKRNLEAQGGYAAFHGSGRTRHLHAVYGDTATPRRSTLRGGGGGGGGDAGLTLTIEGPLIGQVVANNEIDLERAVKRGIRAAERERRERS